MFTIARFEKQFSCLQGHTKSYELLAGEQGFPILIHGRRVDHLQLEVTILTTLQKTDVPAVGKITAFRDALAARMLDRLTDAEFQGKRIGGGEERALVFQANALVDYVNWLAAHQGAGH